MDDTLKQIKEKATSGDAEAQFGLGIMYYSGEEVSKNYKEAMKWYAKAAEQGHLEAQLNLGIMYRCGEGGAKNYSEAYKWLFQVAMADIDETEDINCFCGLSFTKQNAQFNLGEMYYLGDGVEQNYKEAFKWFTKSAEQKNEKALIALGNMYYYGDGIHRDYKKAFELFMKAAGHNYEENMGIQFILGVMYAEGQGVVQNYMEAYKWFLIVGMNAENVTVSFGATPEEIVEAKGFRQKEKVYRDKISERITAGQIKDSQKRAKEFVESKSIPF